MPHAVRNFALKHTATHCNTLQLTATHCSTLQHTATQCIILQRTNAQRMHNTSQDGQCAYVAVCVAVRVAVRIAVCVAVFSAVRVAVQMLSGRGRHRGWSPGIYEARSQSRRWAIQRDARDLFYLHRQLMCATDVPSYPALPLWAPFWAETPAHVSRCQHWVSRLWDSFNGTPEHLCVGVCNVYCSVCCREYCSVCRSASCGVRCNVCCSGTPEHVCVGVCNMHCSVCCREFGRVRCRVWCSVCRNAPCSVCCNVCCNVCCRVYCGTISKACLHTFVDVRI